MKQRAFIFIILAGIAWGTSGIFVHFLAPMGFTSLQMTFLRGLISFIALFLYSVLKDRKLLKTSLKEMLLFACIGLSFFGTASCYFASMQMTSVSTAVVLMYTAPILVMIYSVAFLGEKLTVLKIVSVIAMVSGCGLVSGIIGGLKFDALGIAVGFLSGISYAAYNILTKIAMKRKNNPVTVTLYCFLASVIIAFLVCKPQGIVENIAGNVWYTLPMVIAMGLCTCFLPYILYTNAMKVLPAGTATSLGIVEPMAATVFSVVFFSEPLGISSACGIILILGAVFLLSRSED